MHVSREASCNQLEPGNQNPVYGSVELPQTRVGQQGLVSGKSATAAGHSDTALASTSPSSMLRTFATKLLLQDGYAEIAGYKMCKASWYLYVYITGH